MIAIEVWLVGIDGSGGEYQPSVILEDSRSKAYLTELEHKGNFAVMGKVAMVT